MFLYKKIPCLSLEINLFIQTMMHCVIYNFINISFQDICVCVMCIYAHTHIWKKYIYTHMNDLEKLGEGECVCVSSCMREISVYAIWPELVYM